LLRIGRSFRIAAQVLGASFSSRRALNVKGPAVIRSIGIAGVRYRPLMATLSTHVLDTASGRPASGVAVSLEKDGAVIARGVTDKDGRIAQLAGPLEPGRYRLIFDLDIGNFFRRIALDVEIGAEPKYHVPLLVTPFGVTSYRGS
jgi:5-hydroxyisourate hydrolase